MLGTLCENDWFERGEEETGQEPKEPIQLDGVTDDKDKGQEKKEQAQKRQETMKKTKMKIKKKLQKQEKKVKKYGYAVYVEQWRIKAQ